jgi:hypothetical protein
MSLDRVQPLKLEDTSSGGDSTDLFPTCVDRNSDYIDSRGLAVQDGTSNDETTVLGRSGSDMIFKDVNNPTFVTLTQLLAGSVARDNKFLVFKTDGGLIYDTSGNVVEKEFDT